MAQPGEDIIKVKFAWTDVPKSIYYFLDQDRKRWVTLNVILLVVLFYEVIPPLLLARIVDFFTKYKPGTSLTPFYQLAIFLGVSHAIASLIRLASKNRLQQIAIHARTRARISGFERLINLPLKWHAQENTGNKIERIFTGSQSLLQWTNVANNSLFPTLIAFVGIFVIFLFTSPSFVIFLAGYLAVFFGIEFGFNRRLSELSHQITAAKQHAAGRYVEGSGNILAIKALGAERGLHNEVRQTEEATRQLMLRRTTLGVRKWYAFQTLSGIGFTIFALLVGWRVIDGAISIGFILTYFIYFNRLREAANDATDLSSQLIDMKADLAGMMPIFRDTEPVITGHESFPKENHDIIIRNGSFAYPSGQIGLANLDLDMPQGRVIGVAGPSGGGKSTLVKIMLGLYPLKSGTFTIGEKSYYDIEHEQTIANIAVVLQETELFNFTLRENVTLLREVDEAKLQHAVRIAQLDTVIEKLPKGLDTLIGERGYKLSGGERQRLGIARAIYKDAPIMILDEATSSLDSQTEKNILDVLLAEFAKSKTILIIAHRISTLKNTDRVIFIDQGAVVETGTYQDLITHPSSKLAHLYAMQAGWKVTQ